MEQEELGAAVRQHRRQARLTIERLAEASGVSPRSLSDIELGRSRGPQRATVALLADALGLSASDRDRLLRAAASARAQLRARPASVRLPPRTADFIGRDEELDHLAAATGVALVTGAAGIGKTTLATEFGRRQAGQYPGGVHVVELHGLSKRPVSAAEALAHLLPALGVQPRWIPADPAERAGAYRRLLSARPSLVILDDAAGESQIEPLLPGEGSSLTVVTSRSSLAGLTGVRRLHLNAPSAHQAGHQFRTILARAGHDEQTVDPGAVASVVALCENLPLAVRIAADTLLSCPSWTVADLAAHLTPREQRLSRLAAGEHTIRAALAASYEQLSTSAARLFRRLPLMPGPDFGVEPAAVAAELSLPDAEQCLEEIVDMGLLQSLPDERYRLVELVSLFAEESR